jgi:hypothetical protein
MKAGFLRAISGDTIFEARFWLDYVTPQRRPWL